jgi:hypothetical protein
MSIRKIVGFRQRLPAYRNWTHSTVIKSRARSKCAIMSSVVFGFHEYQGWKVTDALTELILVCLNTVLLAEIMQRRICLCCIKLVHMSVTQSKSGRISVSELLALQHHNKTQFVSTEFDFVRVLVLFCVLTSSQNDLRSLWIFCSNTY